MDPLADDALLMRISKDRDEEAFSVLFARYEKSAYNLALYLLRDPQLAEDAVQEAMLEIWHHGAYQEGNARGWIMRIVTHRCISLARKRQRTLKRQASSEPETLAAQSSPPVQKAEHEELLASLRGMLDGLSEGDRFLVALHYGEGQSHHKIADALSLPRSTVTFKLKQILETLRTRLGQAGLAAVTPLSATLLGEALQTGAGPAPGLGEKIMARLAEPAEAVREVSRRAAAAPARWGMAAWVSLGLALFLAGAVWWVQHPPSASPGTASSEPNETAPFMTRTWDFNANTALPHIEPVQDGWHWVDGDGADSSGYMESDGEYFAAELDLPELKLPIMITYRSKLLNPSGTPLAITWSGHHGRVVFNEPLSREPGTWQVQRACVTEDFIRVWKDGQPNGVSFVERTEHARLRLNMVGRQGLDDLTIREIAPEDVPDVSAYRAALGAIDPKGRFGTVVSPKQGASDPERAISFVPPLESFVQQADLPPESNPPAQSETASGMYSRTWTFDSPETARDFTVLQGTWRFLPGGGPKGSACMETTTDDFRFCLKGRLPRMPLLVTCGVMILPLSHGSDRFPLKQPALRGVHRFEAEFDFPNYFSELLSWERMRTHVTAQYADAWTNERRLSILAGQIESVTELGIAFRYGRVRIRNLTVRELRPDEVPDISAYLAALKQIDPAQRNEERMLTEVDSGVPGQPVIVRFFPP